MKKKKVFIGLYRSRPYYIQNENSSFKIYNVFTYRTLGMLSDWQ